MVRSRLGYSVRKIVISFSSPLAANPASEDDGAGLDIALSAVLPWFLVLSAAFSLGIAEKLLGQAGPRVARVHPVVVQRGDLQPFARYDGRTSLCIERVGCDENLLVLNAPIRSLCDLGERFVFLDDVGKCRSVLGNGAEKSDAHAAEKS